MNDDPFAPLNIPIGAPASQNRHRRCVVPVPDTAPQAPNAHPKLGRPAVVWTYRNDSGQLLGFLFRFEASDGSKSFRPLCLFEEPGALRWRWQAWPDNRPIYGLDRLAANPNATVVVVEGEKAADAAQAMLPGQVCITSPGGSNGTAKTDWSALKGRKVVIWPDADDAGSKYADAVAKFALKAGAGTVARIELPSNVNKGWDAADALNAGWSKAQASELLKTAHLCEASGTDSQQTKRIGRKKKQDGILSAVDDVKLWHSPQMQAYASIEINGHIEHWRIESGRFKRWFAGRVYRKTGKVPAGQSLSDALRVLEVQAIEDGVCIAPMFRTGWALNACWLDLCDET